MTVMDLLKEGKENAVSRYWLADRMKTSERAVRKEIERLRTKGVNIISSSHGKGYYLGTDADRETMRREAERRAKSTMKPYGARVIIIYPNKPLEGQERF